MVTLTKFNGDTFSVNVFHIQKVEGQHETRIVYINGNSQPVKETADEVKERIMECYKRIFTGGLLLQDFSSKGYEQ